MYEKLKKKCVRKKKNEKVSMKTTFYLQMSPL